MAGMTSAPAHAGARKLSAEAAALWERFPPRPVPVSWQATEQDRAGVTGRLLAPPFALDNPGSHHNRRLGLLRTLDWLQAQPGGTWQDRWNASGAGADGAIDWRPPVVRWLKDTGRIAADNTSVGGTLGMGLLQLICGDVLRPAISWLLTTVAPRNLQGEMARTRDGAGFAALAALSATGSSGYDTSRTAMDWIAVVLAAKGGTVAEITVGDSLELLAAGGRLFAGSRGGKGPFFYQLLHGMGVFPPGAPPTVRIFNPNVQGRLTVGQLIDRYDIACGPVRDLLVDYLRERQPGVDYTTLNRLATVLGLSFWKDLEDHHPGIDSLRLAPDVAAAWKQRLQTRPARPAGPPGEALPARIPRSGVAGPLMTVRAFYLDIAQWAASNPARWGPWVVPCPVRADDIRARAEQARRKSRMDQRTRERLPILPALVAAVERERMAAAGRLDAAQHATPGEPFTAGGQTLRRSALTHPSTRLWAEDPVTGKRRDLTREEDKAFWAWATVEVLRETGIRVEELTELSHHGLSEYTLPATREKIPLLQIAPSKIDMERVVMISPNLADVLAMIVRRTRDGNGAVPLVAAYDVHEKVWNPAMPLLFQRRIGVENRPITVSAIRELLDEALARADLTDPSGKPLTFVPHDFRRIFTTDAISNGMPPHIAQLILGHRDINTTMGYKTVYPEEVINNHRAFIARRRALRPAEEYRTPTDDEWEEFLGHFERRRVALGDCGRAYATPCIHEHSCVRCPLLRPDPAQRPRMIEIRDNLIARITEAGQEGWRGEAEGLKVSLAAAEAKIAQLDGLAARRKAAIDLGMPGFPEIASRAVTAALSRPVMENH